MTEAALQPARQCRINGRFTPWPAIWKRAPLMGLLATVGLLWLTPKADLAIAAPAKPKLVVLDMELTGDLGGPQFTAEHAARLRTESAILRRELESSGLYEVLDNTPAVPLINRLKSQQAYWHDCNGCDLQVGRQLGADRKSTRLNSSHLTASRMPSSA